MSKLSNNLRNVSWPKAIVGMFITCMVSLSVHVVMLQVLNVPYPDGYPGTGLPVFANLACTGIALLIFYKLCGDYFSRYSVAVRCLIIFVLTAMLRESIIRVPIMNAIATTAWRYSIVQAMPRIITIFLLCVLIVPVAPRLPKIWQKIVVAIMIASLVTYVLLPFLNQLFASILKSIEYLNHDEVYKVPYGWQIEVPAYITYAEPVLACFIFAAMLWDRLSKDLVTRTIQFVLFTMIVNSTFIRPFIYVFYSPFNPGLALLSMGQFFLEALSLGLLTSFTWRYCSRRLPARD